MRYARSLLTLPLWLAVAGIVVVGSAGEQSSAGTVRYRATATNLDPRVNVTATLVDFTVTRWSTDDERKQLLDVTAGNDQAKLVATLKALPRVGTMKTPDTLSYDLHYARRTATADGGEQVVLVTNRDIAVWEIANMSRSREYGFTVIELRLDAKGEGEGKLTAATKIFVDRKTGQIVLENYGEQPVRLTNVKRESK